MLVLIVSLISGFLIGLPQQKREKSHGARDHMFISMITSLSIILYYAFPEFGLIFLIAILSLLVTFIILTTIYRMFKSDYPGYTTTLALIMCMVEGLVTYFSFSLAFISSVIFLIILSTKKQFYKIQNLSKIEWNSTVEYIAIVVVLLILIPKDIVIGKIPLISIVYIFVIILTLKYVSYFLLKLQSKNSVYYISLLGGFAHSEATTQELSRMNAHPLSVMLVLQTMIIRVLFIVIIARDIFNALLYPLLITAFLGIVFARHFLKKHITEGKLESIRNPISIKSAFIFSLTYLAAVVTTIILGEITKVQVLSPIVYYSAAIIIGALSGGSSSLFATTAYLNGLVGLNTSIIMIIFGLTASIFNKLIYSYRSRREQNKRYYIRLLLYQFLTVFMLFVTTLIFMRFFPST